MIIDPRGFSNISEWADRVTLDLVQYGPIPRLDDPEQWKTWAEQLILIPGISNQSPPEPQIFDDWMDWVFAFNLAVDY